MTTDDQWVYFGETQAECDAFSPKQNGDQFQVIRGADSWLSFTTDIIQNPQFRYRHGFLYRRPLDRWQRATKYATPETFDHFL